MNVTIKDIAKLAGVSYSTVSKALRNSTLVRPDTKQRIVELATQLKYEPNLMAKSLVQRRSMTVGIILPSLDRVAISALVKRINDELALQGYEVILSILPLRSAVRLFQRLQVDGIVVFEDMYPEEIQNVPIVTEIPLLTIGSSHVTGSRFAMVDVKRREAIEKAIQYLAQRGHHFIGYIGDTRDADHKQQEKLIGFYKAMEQHIGHYDQLSIINSNGNSWQQGFESGRQFIAMKILTAVVVGAFDLTAGFLRALLDAGISVPGDVSVISYDHIPQLAELEVPITAVGTPVNQFAIHIAQSLVSVIKSDSPIVHKQWLDTQLVERNSCRDQH